MAASTALAAGVAQAQAGVYRTICEESFDITLGANMDAQGSGFGWESLWWAGGTAGFHSVTVPPVAGFVDQVGNAAFTNKTDLGSYRRVSGVGFESITDDQFGEATGPLFGKDGSILWISFDAQKVPGGDDTYGGVSLFIFLDPNQVGEYLFMGTPFLFDDWGIDTPTGAPGASTIGQGGVDQPSRMIYRVEFMPGEEHIQFWLNPPTDKPDASVITPDLDLMIPDFRFNEVRIQSGGGGTLGGGLVPGFWFDGIRIECEDCEPPNALEGDVDSISITTGGTQVLDLNAGPDFAGLTYFVLGSLSGTSPGFPIDGLLLPLNFDSYMLTTATFANTPPLSNSLGALDGEGKAQASFTVPAGVIPLFGQTANHAYIVIDLAPFPVVTFASNAVSIDFGA